MLSNRQRDCPGSAFRSEHSTSLIRSRRSTRPCGRSWLSWKPRPALERSPTARLSWTGCSPSGMPRRFRLAPGSFSSAPRPSSRPSRASCSSERGSRSDWAAWANQWALPVANGGFRSRPIWQCWGRSKRCGGPFSRTRVPGSSSSPRWSSWRAGSWTGKVEGPCSSRPRRHLRSGSRARLPASGRRRPRNPARSTAPSSRWE